MDRQQILNLYEWRQGVCFRHPDKGTVDTTVVKRIRTQGAGIYEVRACADCLIAMEDTRRKDAADAGVDYEPGHVGEGLG